MNQYEQRLRTAILKQLAEDRRKFDDDFADEDLEEEFKNLDRFSAAEFSAVTGDFESFVGSEKIYTLLSNGGDGLYCNTYAIVDRFYGSPDDVLITRIKMIFTFVEGAAAVIYNAEYGEDGIEFDVPDFVAVSTTPPPLAPADQIREAFARAAEEYKRGEMTVFELDTVLDLIVPRR